MRVISFIFAVAVLAATAACADKPRPTDSSSATSPPAIAALATTRQIMLGITIPTSEILFQAGARSPADDSEWEKMRANAMALAESGNLLKIGARVVDQLDWLKHCDALIDTAQAAAQAAQEKNVDKVLEAGNQIYEVCDACHKKYMAARGGV